LPPAYLISVESFIPFVLHRDALERTLPGGRYGTVTRELPTKLPVLLR
jgi:hypothetical protein